ncbi:MAG: hypothetical protein HQ518_26095 [Rhodopirellula sp.]|jgi:hypothetical protein|nr:hypothetical protein [Rhodopirellula sp.]
MSKLLPRSACALLGCLLFISGCGSEDPLGRVAVTGAVMLDDQPVNSGTIRFSPIEGNQHATVAGAPITNGLYKIAQAHGLASGTYKVFVSASQSESEPGDPMAPGYKEPVARELIPARYNTQTELTAEISTTAKKNIDFSLTSSAQ